MSQMNNHKKTDSIGVRSGLNKNEEPMAQLIADLLQGTQRSPKSKSIKHVKPSKANPIESKMESLDRFQKLLVSNKSILKEVASNKEMIEDLFSGLNVSISSCQLFAINQNSIDKQSDSNPAAGDQVVEVILLANQFILELLPEITVYDEFEKQVALMIPGFIENLGSPKAVVRKSTHKCIGTYVKLTKKLEFVLQHIIKTGLENSNSRTRQHSMLVLPALMSLKPNAVSQENADMKELILGVVKRIQSDSSEIVAKTGKKLLLELQKCYPNSFKSKQVENLNSEDAKLICHAVLNNEDARLRELLSRTNVSQTLISDDNRSQPSVSQKQETVKDSLSTHMSSGTTPKHSVQTQSTATIQPASTKPLIHERATNKAGREIMGNAGRDILQVPSRSIQVDEKEATLKATVNSTIKQQPSQPPMQDPSNGLIFGFLEPQTIEDLDDNKGWKERTAAIETIDERLNQVINSEEMRNQFLPHISAFLDVILKLIKDINFKICLTAINITRKLLGLDKDCFFKHKTNLTTSLIEKLSDSKVVIRQSVLKCCGFIVKHCDNGLMTIAYHAIGYLQHTNWQVREGILYLIADCIITQGNMDELRINDEGPQETLDPNHFSFNSHFISEMCTLAKLEQKSKIQQMVIDCLALTLEISPNRPKTEQIILKESSHSSKQKSETDFTLINQIKQRQNKDYLPALQIDGTIEFKPSGVISDVLPPSPKKSQEFSASIKSYSGQNNENQPYMQMRYQQQRIQQNSNPQLQQVAPNQGGLLPTIGPRDDQPPSSSPAMSRKLDASPYAQMMEKNRQYSVTVNNDLQNSMVAGAKNAQNYHTPDISYNEINHEQRMPSKSTYARGPAPQSLLNKKHESLVGSGLQPSKNEQALASKDDKVGIWMPQRQQQQANSKSPYAMQKQQKQLDKKRLNHGNTSNNLDDGRSIKTTATHESSHNQKNQSVISALQAKSNSHFQAPSTQDASTKLGYTPESHQNKPRNLFSIETRQRTLDGDMLSNNSQIQQIGHSTKQDFISIQQSPRMVSDQKQLTGQIGRATQGIINSEIKAQQRNMSQSSGAPDGFNLDKTQINQRLQLLKSTFKYKNASEIDQNEEIKTFDNSDRIKYEPYQMTKAESEHNSRHQNTRMIVSKNSNNYMTPNNFDEVNPNPQQTHNSFGLSNISTNMKMNSQTGFKDNSPGLMSQQKPFAKSGMNYRQNVPVKPTEATRKLRDGKDINTINFDDQNYPYSEQNNSQLNLTKQHVTAPPLPRKPSHLTKQNSDTDMLMQTPSDVKRVNSVHHNYSVKTKKRDDFGGDHTQTSYNAPDEPLANPDAQLKSCLENLKTDDWQKIFDSLNVIKRLCSFHRETIQQHAAAKELIKGVVRHTDSMRSQLSKNSCMTLQAIYSQLPTKELDSVVDIVLTSLLKKATDTNHFVSEQAEKALAMVCHSCSESKVFTCLQMIPNKGANHKQKTCICYGHIIQKLGSRITSFKECVSLVKTVVNMLSEGSQEVRNAAKLTILTIKNNFSSQKEFDALMARCGLTERQLDQTKKVIEFGDMEQHSNLLHTKYSQSMRGSSLDSRGIQGQQRSPNKMMDGTETSFNLNQSYMSPNSSAANGFQATDSSFVAFKKRQQSVSKPIDPQVYETFRSLVDQCMLPDWQKRLNGLGSLNNWVQQHSSLIKNNQQSKFIQLIDVQCKLIQDNNAKVQSQAIKTFRDFLSNENLRQLIDQNLTMIIQAITHNLSSTSNNVRTSNEQLLTLVEDKTQNINQMVHPIIAQINLPNNKVKSYLLQRLILLIPRLETGIIDRQLMPLTRPTHKLQQEATTNPGLRDQLKVLDMSLNK